MKTIICPHCHQIAATLQSGRKSKGLAVKNVCDAIVAKQSVTLAAQNLKCSRALVYKILKANGLTAAEVLRVSR